MPNNNDSFTNLHHLLDYDARRYLCAEVQLKNMLPEWIRASNSLKLKSILNHYLELVEDHIAKLEIFFEDEKINSVTITNRIMQALIEETEEKITRSTDAQIKDAALLASIQIINHFKISTYGTAAAFSKALDNNKYASFFHDVDVNEKQIDYRLTQLAEKEINMSAKAPILLHS